MTLREAMLDAHNLRGLTGMVVPLSATKGSVLVSENLWTSYTLAAQFNT